MSIESLVCIERVAIDPEVATADVRSHYKTALGSTHQSARRPRNRTVEFAEGYEWRVMYKKCCQNDDVIACPDDRKRIAGFLGGFLKLGHELCSACGHDLEFLGEKYTTFSDRMCRGCQDFPVQRAEDSGGDDNPVQGCTKRVTLKAERCRRRHFFHIAPIVFPTSGQ